MERFVASLLIGTILTLMVFAGCKNYFKNATVYHTTCINNNLITFEGNVTSIEHRAGTVVLTTTDNARIEVLSGVCGFKGVN